MYSPYSSMGSLLLQEKFCMLVKKKAGYGMDTISAIRDRILHLCSDHNITINKLAKLSALPPSSIKNILYGKSKDPKILTIKKICDGFDITLIDFFNSSEFENLEPEIR